MCREVTAPWSRKMDRMAAVSQVFAIVVFLFVIIDLVSFFGRQLFSSVLGRIHLDLVESRDILLNRPHNNLFIFIPFIQHLIIQHLFNIQVLLNQRYGFNPSQHSFTKALPLHWSVLCRKGMGGSWGPAGHANC